MSLGILTDEGRIATQREKEMLDFLANKWRVQYISVDKITEHSTAYIDGFFVRDGTVVSAFESKCRQKWEGYDSLIITADKLDRGATLAAMLVIPYIVLAYIVERRLIYYWKVTDIRGVFQFRIRRENTVTQKTIAGGEVTRLNAFLPVSEATLYRMDKDVQKAAE
jgi:hypothetical protein